MLRCRHFITAYSIAAFGYAAMAQAAGADSQTQITVSATRIETPVKQVGSSLSVVDSGSIRQRQVHSAQAALRMVPGIQSLKSGGPGTTSSVFIRGAKSNHTLVMVNGMRVNSNTSGGFDLSSFPVASIERIEVLRGPQSAMYGSDAIGGVLNIITKKGANQAASGTLSAEAGEEGLLRGSLSFTAGNETLDINTAITFLEIDGLDISGRRGGTEDDAHQGVSAYAGIGLNFGDEGRANLTLLYNETDTDLDTNAPYPDWWQVDDEDRSVDTKRWITRADVALPVSEKYTQRVAAGVSRETSEGSDDGSREYRFESENVDASAQADLVLESGPLSMGYDFRHSEAENDTNYEAQSREQHALFVNKQWNVDNALFLTLGGRYDDFSDISAQATWRAALSWFARESTRVHGSVGTGYKAPTMNDLYWPATAFAGGNPDLDPEESLSFDIGVEETLIEETLIADLTYFQSAIDDLIDWADDGTGFWTPSNVEKAKIKGVELGVTANPGEGWSTRLFYTYTDAENDSTGKRLARRAEHTAGLSADWDCTDRIRAHGEYLFVGTRYDDDRNSRELDDYGLVNLGVRVEIGERSTINASIKNLLDENYETAGGYAQMGRQATIGIEVSL